MLAARTAFFPSRCGSISTKHFSLRRRGHVEDLPLREREAPHGELRGVGIHLDDQGAPPHGHLAEQLRGALGAGEVRDASDGAGESRDPFPLHRQPDLLADLRLRHRDAGG
jgi:hypothetical protein